jgi:Glycolipid 2-alpha-mannosyltransferase
LYLLGIAAHVLTSILLMFGSWHVDWDMYHKVVIQADWETSRDFQSLKMGQTGTANATFVFLARNNEIDSVIRTLWEIEDSFNSRFHYPYVFLNDVPFSEEFRR